MCVEYSMAHFNFVTFHILVRAQGHAMNHIVSLVFPLSLAVIFTRWISNRYAVFAYEFSQLMYYGLYCTLNAVSKNHYIQFQRAHLFDARNVTLLKLSILDNLLTHMKHASRQICKCGSLPLIYRECAVSVDLTMMSTYWCACRDNYDSIRCWLIKKIVLDW